MSSSKLVCVSICCILLILSNAAMAAQDTPEKLQHSAKAIVASHWLSGANAANRFFVTMSSDRKFSAQFLRAGRNKDIKSLISLFSRATRINPNNITVEEVKSDFYFTGTGRSKYFTLRICFDTEDSQCGGKSWSISFGPT